MIERHIISGKSVLQKFLKSQASVLSASPILLVSSTVGGDGLVVPAVEHACQKTQFLTSMQLDLRTIPSNISSAFCTAEQVQATLKLAQRTGALTVVGVGSGAAMDLAKAVSREMDSGILVPATYGAILAASSSHPLVLDTQEQALVVSHKDLQETKNELSVVIETNAIADIYKRDAAWACLSMAIDSVMRNQSDALNVLDNAFQALDDETRLPEGLVSAAGALNYGINGDTRSIPMALAASLIPSYFPRAPVLEFFASLVPGMCQVSDVNDTVRSLVQNRNEEIPSLASLADSAPSVDTLMQEIWKNQALWQCIDVDDEVLEAILHHCLNR